MMIVLPEHQAKFNLMVEQFSSVLSEPNGKTDSLWVVDRGSPDTGLLWVVDMETQHSFLLSTKYIGSGMWRSEVKCFTLDDSEVFGWAYHLARKTEYLSPADLRYMVHYVETHPQYTAASMSIAISLALNIPVRCSLAFIKSFREG